MAYKYSALNEENTIDCVKKKNCPQTHRTMPCRNFVSKKKYNHKGIMPPDPKDTAMLRNKKAMLRILQMQVGPFKISTGGVHCPMPVK